MNNNIFIDPKIDQDYSTISYFQVEFLNLILNTSVLFRVKFYNSNNLEIRNIYLNIEGDEYKNWGYDDNYLIELICKKYNFILKSDNIEK